MRAWGPVVVTIALVGCNEPTASPSGSTGASTATVRLNVTGAGTVRIASLSFQCRGSCEKTVAKGTSLHLEAVPDAGAEFRGWGGGCSGGSACDLKLDADAQVQAEFATSAPPPGQSSLAVSVVGSGSGHVRSTPAGIDCPGTCAMTAQRGSTVSLSAEADAGSTFSQWGGICTGSGGCSVTLDLPVTAVSATFTIVQPPDDCAGFAPAAPGSPSVFRTGRGPADGTYCMPGASNGAGVLALATEDVRHNPLFHFSFVSSGGTVLNTFDGNWHLMIDQLDGFEAVDTQQIDQAPWDLVVFSREGKVLKRTPAPGAFFVNNPIGGVVVVDDKRVSSFDENGTLRFELQVNDPFPAVDRQGNLLILNWDRASGNNARFFGRWVDPAGHVGPVFTAIDGLGNNYSLSLQPRVGSGLFLHVESWDLATNSARGGTWIKQFEPLVAASSDPPPWLATRGETKRIHMAHGGRAYAFLPDAQKQMALCSQRVEVVSPSGKSCGFVGFDVAPGPCTTESIDVGYDGTVIQQLPRQMEPVDAQGNASCTWRYWPGYFR